MKSHTTKYWLEKIKALDPEAEAKVLEFFSEPENLNLETRSKANYTRIIYYLLRETKKPLKDITEQDVKQYLAKRNEKISPSSLSLEFAILRKFLRYTGLDLNFRLRPKSKLEYHLVDTKDFLTEEEFRRLYNSLKFMRDKALIKLLRETGMRIGEALALNIRDLEISGNTAIIHIRRSKKKPRQIPIIESLPELKAWLREHPDKRPDSPLFVKLRGKPERLTYSAFWDSLHEALKRSGLKKRVHPHLFRHIRATELLTKLPEEVAREVLGWVHGSRMVARYSHVTNDKANQVYLRTMYGLKIGEEEEEKGVKECPRCGAVISAKHKFCPECGQVLDFQKALEIQEMKDTLAEVFKILTQDPKALERLKKFLRGEA